MTDFDILQRYMQLIADASENGESTILRQVHDDPELFALFDLYGEQLTGEYIFREVHTHLIWAVLTLGLTPPDLSDWNAP